MERSTWSITQVFVNEATPLASARSHDSIKRLEAELGLFFQASCSCSSEQHLGPGLWAGHPSGFQARACEKKPPHRAKANRAQNFPKTLLRDCHWADEKSARTRTGSNGMLMVGAFYCEPECRFQKQNSNTPCSGQRKVQTDKLHCSTHAAAHDTVLMALLSRSCSLAPVYPSRPQNLGLVRWSSHFTSTRNCGHVYCYILTPSLLLCTYKLEF